MTNRYRALSLPLYNTKDNNKVSSLKQLLAPFKRITRFTKKNFYSRPSTYSYSSIKPTFAKTKTKTRNASDGLLKTYIFPTANNLNNIINNNTRTNHHKTKEYINKKTLSMSPSPHFPPFIVKSDKHKYKYKRCKHGYKRNNITKRCNKNK